MNELYIGLTVIAVMLLAGVCSSKLSSYLNVPVLLVFLGVGMLAGTHGIGGLSIMDAPLANSLGSLAMAFILFSGGFDTNWKSIRPVLTAGGLLSSVGVLITAGITGVFVSYLSGMPLEWGLLLGAIVSSTDAAAVFAILRSRSVGLRGKVKPLLELESGSNDPMAAFLTIFMVGILQHPGGSYALIFPMFFQKMALGLAFGCLCGRAAVWLFNRIALEYDGLYYVLGITAVLISFGGGELAGGNGFLSVYVCGVVMGNSKFIYQHGIGRFHDAVGWLMQLILFGTLGLLVNPAELPGVSVNALLIALFLMFFARPLAVWICLLKSSFSVQEKLFVSWVGLRGGAPIVLATFPMLAKIPEYQQMFNIVFFIVLASVLSQSKTLMFLARRLRLDSPLRLKSRIPLEFENTGNLDGDLREFEISQASPYIGKTIAELNLPEGALILLIRRERNFVVPHGRTLLLENDGLLILAAPETLAKTEPIFISSES